MTRRWKKLGLIYAPGTSGRHPKLISHAANPLPIHMDGDIYRVFYSGRDDRNRSSVGAVDVNIVQRRVVGEHYLPFFQHGPEGSFFADGVSIGSCYMVGGVRYMLFMGWQNPANGHWRGDIGRLIVTPDLTLELAESEPFMGSDHSDPISLSYPWVLPSRETGYDMWYGSTRAWDAGNGEMLHVIQHASSKDGHHWQRSGLAVPYELGQAQAFSRPTVVAGKQRGLEMWFSFRGGSGETYRIGYAVSSNGRDWTLELDRAGITVSDTGWDSEMIEYPYVFDHGGSRYMLYNGNGHGRSGFGMAILDGS
jgi:hypothetical protein